MSRSFSVAHGNEPDGGVEQGVVEIEGLLSGDAEDVLDTPSRSRHRTSSWAPVIGDPPSRVPADAWT